MKKLFYVAAVIAMSLLCYACSQDQEPVQSNGQSEEQQLAFDNLYADIALLNAQFGVDNASISRGGGRRRFWSIFGADLLGGILGCRVNLFFGFYWGVFSSITAVVATEPEIEDQYRYRPARTTASYVSANTENATLGLLDSLGYYHNQVICDLYDQYGDALFTLDELTRETVVLEAIQPYIGENTSSYANIAVTEKYNLNQLVLNMNSENLDETFQAAIAMAPTISNELNIVKNYCETLQYFESDQDLILYSIAHDNLVRASDIDADAQELILAGTAIGGNSAIMWEKEPIVPGLEIGDELP